MPDVTLRCLDLFAGRGTASRPFRDRGWEVTTVELDPLHRPDIVADINDWEPPFKPDHFDFIWASPPCTAFSKASGGRHFRKVPPEGDSRKRKRSRWRPDFMAQMSRSLGPELGPKSGHPEGPSRGAGGAPPGRALSTGPQPTPAAYPFRRSRIEQGEVIPLTPSAVEGVIMVEKTLDLIGYLNPSFWVVENPSGYLRSIIGLPEVVTSYCTWGSNFLKPTDLWGSPPPGIDWNAHLCTGSLRRCGNVSHGSLRADQRSAIIRAEVPYRLGWSLAEACEVFFLDGSLI